MSTMTADLVILGGGSAGYACALRAAQLGRSVVLVERDALGGTCLHRGCVPTKALLHAAEVADEAREGAAYGVRSTYDGVDVPALHAYQDGVVGRLHRGLEGLVAKAGVSVVRGEGVLTGPRTVAVDGVAYTGSDLVLATGSHPRSLPGVEVGGRVVTSDQALRLDAVPARAVVIGGGVIGVELASVWRSFGAEVTIVEALPSLVPGEDPTISRLLERALRRRGIVVRTGTGVSAVDQDERQATVTLAGGEALVADVVLVAVGRGPASAGLGLAEHGVGLDRGWVTVDERLRTAVPHVFAVGDLVAGPQLAHRGFAHGLFVAEEIAGLHPEPVSDAALPRVTYSDPEIASVGLTEPQAVERFGEVDTYEYDLGGNAKSQILRTSGVVKLVREKDGPVVGVHLIGRRIGEQVGEAALLVGWEALPDDVSRFVHAHPTQNEALGEAALALSGRPLHAHP